MLVVVGQVATVVLVGLGLLWIPMMKLISGQIYQYLQSVQAYISPPIAAVFLIGIAWQRVNSAGAIAALGTGFVLGMLRLVLELNKATGMVCRHQFPALRHSAVRDLLAGTRAREPWFVATVPGPGRRADPADAR